MHWMILVLALSGCSWKNRVKYLSDTEFDHYYALRTYMSDDQKKTYLKKETEEERNAYLHELGLWDRFYQYEPHIRELIVAGDVQTGWTKDMLYMSWGAPFDKRRLSGRKAERSELFVYRFEEQPDGSILVWQKGSRTEYKAVRLFSREVILDDDKVAEITDRAGSW